MRLQQNQKGITNTFVQSVVVVMALITLEHLQYILRVTHTSVLRVDNLVINVTLSQRISFH